MILQEDIMFLLFAGIAMLVIGIVCIVSYFIAANMPKEDPEQKYRIERIKEALKELTINNAELKEIILSQQDRIDQLQKELTRKNTESALREMVDE